MEEHGGEGVVRGLEVGVEGAIGLKEPGVIFIVEPLPVESDQGEDEEGEPSEDWNHQR